MDLVRDLLDTLVVDRHGREMGRVDDIWIELRDGAPPRVTGIEIGASTLFARVRPIFGRWMAALEHALGIDEGRPVTIPFTKILDITHAVKVDQDFTDTAVSTLEQRLARVIASIPGAK